jgi:BlaI family transcriptional regulator, penicillinase repressor
MAKPPHLDVSRRERQIMEVLYQKGQASVAEVLDAMPDPPGYSAVRAMLRLLEEKGHIRHKKDGKKYVFMPKVAREKVSKSALRNVVTTFFDGSVEQAVASLLDLNQKDLSCEDLDRLSDLIDQARKEGR